MSETIEYLERQRAAVIDKLRGVAPQLIVELEVWDRAIRDLSSASPIQSEKYLIHKSAINAIIDFLQETGKPATPGDIAKAVLDGGWLKGDPRRRANVYDSIRFHVKNHDAGKLKLFRVKEKITPEFLKKYNSREDDYLVGLRDWPDTK